jgi:hypothetical protein
VTVARRGPRGRRLALLIVGAAVVGAAIAAVLVLVLGGGQSSTTRHGSLPQARVQQLEQALVSQDPATQQSALDPAVFANLQQGGQSLLPAGSSLTVDRSTERVEGHTATVSATVTGSRSGKFTLQLALEDGTWVVFAAEPA